MQDNKEIKNGAAAAAFLAAGIGSLVLGVATTIGEAFPAVGATLNVFKPVGPLSGETGVEVVVWIVAWLVLHQLWKNKQVNLKPILTATFILIALGFLGTFPIFFDMFLTP